MEPGMTKNSKELSLIVNLYQNGSKSRTVLSKEYGVFQTALTRSIKQYSTVQADDGVVLTVKQVRELQKRNAQLEDENLKKLFHLNLFRLFTPHSNND